MGAEAAFGPVSAGIGATLGYVFNRNLMEEQHQYNMAENAKAAGLNFTFGEQAAQNADTRARMFYEDYNSPQAMVRQLEAAGLSPALMYGGGGGSGQGHASTQGAQGAGAGNQQGKSVVPSASLITEGALAASQVAKNMSEVKRNDADANATNTYKKDLFEAERLNWDIRNAKDSATLGADVMKAWAIIDNMAADTQVKHMQAFETLTSAWDNIAEIHLKKDQAELLKKQAKYYDAAAENFGLTREMERELREKGFEVEMLKNNGKLGLMLWYGKKFFEMFPGEDISEKVKPQDSVTTGVHDKSGTKTGYKMGDWSGMK